MPPAAQLRMPALTVLAWYCPVCDGSGEWAPGESCLHCHGFGLTDREGVAGWEDPRPAPRPPSVMARQCRDCAYRADSPESDQGEPGSGGGAPPGRERPFWCHQGMPVIRGAYVPVLTCDGMPIGAKLCAGWWDTQAMSPVPGTDHTA